MAYGSFQCLDRGAGKSDYIRPVAVGRRMSTPFLAHLATPPRTGCTVPIYALVPGPDYGAKSCRVAKG